MLIHVLVDAKELGQQQALVVCTTLQHSVKVFLQPTLALTLDFLLDHGAHHREGVPRR
jgi:hypothetical protein